MIAERGCSGTLLSLKSCAVQSVVEIDRPRPDNRPIAIGPSTPAGAALHQRVVARQLAADRQSHRPVENSPPRSTPPGDAYRPGRGIAYPAAPNDYEVGRTFAPPASGRVYEGEARDGAIVIEPPPRRH